MRPSCIRWLAGPRYDWRAHNVFCRCYHNAVLVGLVVNPFKVLGIGLLFALLAGCAIPIAPSTKNAPQRIMRALEVTAEVLSWCEPCVFPIKISPTSELIAETDRYTWEILISDGMLSFIENDDELAFVFAHETAHRVLGIMSTRMLETQADILGAFLMARAGFDPRRGLLVLNRLAAFFPATRSLGGYPSMLERTLAVEQALETRGL